MKLSKRTVLVTGGTSGIGFGIAEAFYKLRSNVIICGRNEEKLSFVKKKYPEITTIQCDIGNSQQRKGLAEEVLNKFPELDILVNNAGVQKYIDLKKGFDELTSGEDEISINFTATVELTSLFINHLMNKPSAAVINITSGLAFMPMLSTPIYNATKAAVHTYTLVLREQLKDTSVKVIEIVPPMVDTDLNKNGRNKANLKFRGISLSEYMPGVIKGLENDEEIIFHGDAGNILNEPRGAAENRLLEPTW